MTFEEVKTELLNRARRLEVCDAYYAILLSTTFQELLLASCGVYIWAYSTGVVDDTLLEEFPEIDLNAFGIYTTGTPSLTNPDIEDYEGCHDEDVQMEAAPDEYQHIYCTKDTDLTLVLDNGNCHLYLLGNSNANITLDGNSKLELTCRNNGTASITVNDNSLLCLSTESNGLINIYSNNNAISLIKTNFNAHVTYQGDNSSYGNLSSFGNSLIEYLLLGSSTIDKIARFQSKITAVVP